MTLEVENKYVFYELPVRPMVTGSDAHENPSILVKGV